jgi:hypothetical protein
VRRWMIPGISLTVECVRRVPKGVSRRHYLDSPWLRDYLTVKLARQFG